MPNVPGVEPRRPDIADPIFRLARRVAGGLTAWHRATIDGLDRLPRGPVLMVGNHGLFGFETPAFFYLLHRATGRCPVGLTDRVFFGRHPMRALLSRVGGVLGTRDNAARLLRAGELVVCYPGGAREVFKAPEHRYRLRWERASGFARLAIETGVPVVPFAGLGVDESYVNLGHLPLAPRLLGRYSIPLAVGLGPLPLPVRFQFRLGEPLEPPSHIDDAPSFKELVRAQVERLLARGREHEIHVPFARPALVAVR